MTQQIKFHKKDNFDFQHSDDIKSHKKDNFGFQDNDDTSNPTKKIILTSKIVMTHQIPQKR